jgi:hypothetical protein
MLEADENLIGGYLQLSHNNGPSSIGKTSANPGYLLDFLAAADESLLSSYLFLASTHPTKENKCFCHD